MHTYTRMWKVYDQTNGNVIALFKSYSEAIIFANRHLDWEVQESVSDVIIQD